MGKCHKYTVHNGTVILTFKLLKHLTYMDHYLLLAKIFHLLHTEKAVVFQNTDFLILLFCQMT